MRKDVLEAWLLGCFTDQEIATVFSTSHIDIRKTIVAAGKQPGLGLTSDCKDEIRFMWDNDAIEDLALLAEELGTTCTVVYNAAKGKFADGSNMPNRNMAIIQDLSKGLSQVEVAAKYGVSQSLVSYLNPKPKCKRPRGKKLSEKEWDELLSCTNRFSITDLARMYGVSRASIYARMNK